MAVRIVFKDPGKADRVYPTADRWELKPVISATRVIIKLAGDVIAEYDLADIANLEKE